MMLSLCKNCLSMTKTVRGKCGKCRKGKQDDMDEMLKEKLKIAVEALNKIYTMKLDYRLGQIVGSEHYEKAWFDCIDLAQEALAKIKEGEK